MIFFKLNYCYNPRYFRGLKNHLQLQAEITTTLSKAVFHLKCSIKKRVGTTHE